MNKDIYKKVMDNYQQKRDAKEIELNNRKKEIYFNIPRIKEIDRMISETGINISKLLIENNSKQHQIIEKMKKRIFELKSEKAQLLLDKNYPADYLTIKYDCEQCQDTGYIGNKQCKCLKQSLIDYAYSQSNIGERLLQENFDNFDISLYSNQTSDSQKISPRQNMENIFYYCIKFVQDFDNSNQNLLFYGKPGLGKTYLSNCIAKDLLDQGKIVIYQTAFKLFDIIRKFRFSNATGQQFDLASLLTCDLLIIDDLGTELTNSFTNSELFNIINTRLLDCKNTIISTNLDLNELMSNYSERIISRILGNFQIFKFYGNDIRKRGF
ncbi:MAG: ATP-binding protein [Clostridia bacterium]|nr:ATP-binding protein [Clostridia bacterium]